MANNQNIIKKLQDQNLIHPPKWLSESLAFLGYGGSVSYGASNDTSDMDCMGFCMPPKHIVFPYSVGGNILGFDDVQRFNNWQEHHIQTPNKEYDFSVYNIVDFFKLATDNNPNILDLLFLPRRCILYTTKVGELVRENRKLFLHKGAMQKLRGYAFSQLSKIDNKANSKNPKRAADIEKNGYDTKFLMNVVRLTLQCENILVEHDLDIERNSDILKSIRRGEWTLEYGKEWFAEKEKALETLYANSTLQHSPDTKKIKELLVECMEMTYGKLTNDLTIIPSIDRIIEDMQNVLNKYKQN